MIPHARRALIGMLLTLVALICATAYTSTTRAQPLGTTPTPPATLPPAPEYQQQTRLLVRDNGHWIKTANVPLNTPARFYVSFARSAISRPTATLLVRRFHSLDQLYMRRMHRVPATRGRVQFEAGLSIRNVAAIGRNTAVFLLVPSSRDTNIAFDLNFTVTKQQLR